MLFKCKICGNEWGARPDGILRGSGCPKCAMQKVHDLQRLTESAFLKRVKLVNPNIEVLDKYVNYATTMNCYCKLHKINFTSLARTLIRGTYACPMCQREGSISK